MPQLNGLLHFIVPLTFLAIWALTTLLNRDSQPLPPRTGRAPGPRPVPPLGTRPQAPPRPQPPERRPESILRETNSQWANPTPQRRPPGQPGDDILIIESEPRRTPPTASASGRVAGPVPTKPGAGAPRRTLRARPSPIPPKRAEPISTHRSLSASMGAMSQPLAKLGEINLRTSNQTSFTASDQNDLTRLPANDPPRTMFRSDFISFDIPGALANHAKLREAFILNEVLRPPMALRRERGQA